MHIDRLQVRNFRCFAERTFDFSPQFNVLIGDNGSGKTAVLEALAIAAGGWLIGMSNILSRPIRTGNIRLASLFDGAFTFEDQFPVEVSAWGQVQEKAINWKRTLTSREGKTTFNEAKALVELSKEAEAKVRSGDPVILPVIAYYGAGRLWLPPRKTESGSNGTGNAQRELSRFQGYSSHIEERVNSQDLMRWLERQDRIAYQQQSDSVLYRIVREAMRNMIEGATEIRFDNVRLEVIVQFGTGQSQPYRCLSDGQRSILALTGDLAMRMARLNPQLGDAVLEQTPGIVLIDELDLHLHPNWQRHIVEDLRRIFPKVQFIATTHSPFIVQTLREGELISLESQPIPNLGNVGIEEIAEGIMGVERPEVSPRYHAMVETAKEYLTTVEEAALAPEEEQTAFQERLADQIAPYADNPAYQALLELKRTVKMGK